MANEAIRIDGTQVTVITGASARADGAFSVQAECTALTMTQGTDLYPQGEAVLACTPTLAPTGNKAVHLYRRSLNVDGANNEPEVDANYKHTYVGTFNLDTVATLHYSIIRDVPLTGDDEFYIEVDEAQGINTGYTVKITPWTIAPRPAV